MFNLLPIIADNTRIIANNTTIIDLIMNVDNGVLQLSPGSRSLFVRTKLARALAVSLA